MIARVAKQKGVRTKPEKAMKSFLDMLEVTYVEQHPVPRAGVADFYVPSENLVIEVDGEWWHSLPANVRNDARKNREYAKQGIRVVRISERDLVKRTA